MRRAAERPLRLAGRDRADCPDRAAEYAVDDRPPGDTRARRIDRFRTDAVVTGLAESLRGGSVEPEDTYTGVVRRFELVYTGGATVATDGTERTVPVTQRFVRTYTAVGATTVERPAWVDRAAGDETERRTATAG